MHAVAEVAESCRPSHTVRPGAPVARSADPAGAPCHLQFHAPGCDFDLRVAPHGGRFGLAGQVLGHDGGGDIELARHAPKRAGIERLHGANLDAGGGFRIDGIEAGCYLLILRCGHERVVLYPVDIGVRGR